MSERGFLGSDGCRTRPQGWDGSTRNLDRYSDPDTAPFNKPLHVEVQDAQGPYKLSAFCIRTKDGWVSAVSRKQLLVEVIGWKY